MPPEATFLVDKLSIIVYLIFNGRSLRCETFHAENFDVVNPEFSAFSAKDREVGNLVLDCIPADISAGIVAVYGKKVRRGYRVTGPFLGKGNMHPGFTTLDIGGGIGFNNVETVPLAQNTMESSSLISTAPPR